MSVYYHPTAIPEGLQIHGLDPLDGISSDSGSECSALGVPTAPTLVISEAIDLCRVLDDAGLLAADVLAV